MTSHELAQLLLSLPDLPVATHSLGHTDYDDSGVMVGRMHHYDRRDRLLIGRWHRDDINAPNWYVTETYFPRPSPKEKDE